MSIILACRNLTKSYQIGTEQLEVLKQVNLTVNKGDFLSIMGPSGSGKSTLLHLLGLLDKPDRGDINFLGRDVQQLSGNQLARFRLENMGFVFQSFHLQPRLSALGNVMLPMELKGIPKQERVRKATELLNLVGLGDRLRNKPNELSGGQKQRVAIARALANDPPIIFADEPTGNLDSANTVQVMKLLRALNRQGRTIIQVTHDRQMAGYGNRIIEFRDGTIIRRMEKPTRSAPQRQVPA